MLAATAYDRAVNGVEEAVFHNGQLVGHRVRYNDRLMMFLLRVRDPLNFAPLQDLQGWRRQRDIQPNRPIDPALERLAAAEREWGGHLPDDPAPADRLADAAPSATRPMLDPADPADD